MRGLRDVWPDDLEAIGAQERVEQVHQQQHGEQQAHPGFKGHGSARWSDMVWQARAYAIASAKKASVPVTKATSTMGNHRLRGIKASRTSSRMTTFGGDGFLVMQRLRQTPLAISK